MDKRAILILLIIFGGLFIVFFAFLALALTAVSSPDTRGSRKPQVGVVEITDVIMDSRKVLEALEMFRDDSRIHGIIVRINSPGGAVAPSQEIHDAIIRARAEKKVIASLGATAASGGYYIAVAADEIVSNPGSITGSIGVISQFTNLEGLAEWARIDVETIKSGERKDVGNPFRKMTDGEREYFLILLQDVHEQFLTAVADGRGVDRTVISPFADGRILTGRQALDAGLVDHLGSIEHAVDRMMELADLGVRPQLVYPKRDEMEIIRELFGGVSQAFLSGLRDEIESASWSSRSPSLWFLATSH